MLIFSQESDLLSFQLKAFDNFLVLRTVSNDLETHPETLNCLHKIDHQQFQVLAERYSVNSRRELVDLLEKSDANALKDFHAAVTTTTTNSTESSAVASGWASTPQSEIIVHEALAKGPFDSEVMLVLSDEWTVTNRGANWTLDRNTRHLLNGRIITSTARYFAPAESVRYLGATYGWSLYKDWRIAISEDRQLVVLSAFQEFCTRADLSLRAHNEQHKYQFLEWAVRIYIATTGVTVKTIEQPGQKYELKTRANLKHFSALAGKSKVEQLWLLSKFQFDTWASIAHLAQVIGAASNSENEAKWSWQNLPNLF